MNTVPVPGGQLSMGFGQYEDGPRPRVMLRLWASSGRRWTGDAERAEMAEKGELVGAAVELVAELVAVGLVVLVVWIE